jgi:hypothetical protein
MQSNRGNRQGPSFQGDLLQMRGRFLDSIDLVVDLNIHQVFHDVVVTDESMIAVHFWRVDVLERHSPEDPYILPSGYTNTC